MTKHKASPLSGQILDEATTWFVEFSEGGVGHTARQEFSDWLKTSPEHVRAYLQVAAHWEEARTLSNASIPSVAELVALAREPQDAKVIAIGTNRASGSVKDHASTGNLAREPLDSSVRSHRLWRFVIAASVSTLMIAASAAYWLEYQRGVYSTDIGEQRTIQLADGSTVEVNARSRIRVALHEHERDVELIEGQALFRVAKDHARPFVVHSGETNVLAVGTQFDVHKNQSGTTITVVEGRVAVYPSIPPEATPVSDLTDAHPSRVLLAAGEQLTVSGVAVKRAAHADVAAATAWIQKQIVFNNTPLSEVVDEFNRFNTRQLVIIDPSIADTKISGEFSSTNPDSLLKGLDAMKKFNILETPGRIEISAE